MSVAFRKYFRRFFGQLPEKNKIKWVRVRFVDYRAFDTSNIIPIHKYLMTNDDIK